MPPSGLLEAWWLLVVMAGFGFVLVLLGGCAVGDASRPTVDHDACYASGLVVAEALDALRGPLPAKCRELLATYSIQFVTAAEMPCSSAEGRVIGCSFQPPWRRIYLLEGVANFELVDISAHEWLHVLAGCALGDPDSEHRDAELWGGELDDVLGLALASAPTGPCLGSGVVGSPR